ncbi:hypothetical protein AMS68_002343 [Peltaster fructicola]|uniref:AP complex mu/sigma subunit domain-containing protein n=1 Tax=Peltaster fructicola TaxID=286661 RepID=A0A6H0XQ59_9PEZI|nr:hypothetical protein AMS68_002343 [Peltaster fructicola]
MDTAGAVKAVSLARACRRPAFSTTRRWHGSQLAVPCTAPKAGRTLGTQHVWKKGIHPNKSIQLLYSAAVQQRLISEIYALVSARPASACNFLPLPPLLAPSTSSTGAQIESNDAPSLVTYRSYATLHFIMISTATESPLALLDLIHVYVESLDYLFEDVCELDLIFNFEVLHAVLAEMIVGGVVVETSRDKVVEGVRAQGKVAKRPVNERRAPLGGGLWAR